jgi:hypothetical protein
LWIYQLSYAARVELGKFEIDRGRVRLAYVLLKFNSLFWKNISLPIIIFLLLMERRTIFHPYWYNFDISCLERYILVCYNLFSAKIVAVKCLHCSQPS